MILKDPKLREFMAYSLFWVVQDLYQNRRIAMRVLKVLSFVRVLHTSSRGIVIESRKGSYSPTVGMTRKPEAFYIISVYRTTITTKPNPHNRLYTRQQLEKCRSPAGITMHEAPQHLTIPIDTEKIEQACKHY